MRWQRRAPRARGLALLAAAGAFATMVVATPTLAAFTDASSVGANAFTTSACYTAAFQSVQQGAVSNTLNGIQSVTISSVDPATSFLMFSTASNSNRPVGTEVRGRLASATTVEFERVTNEATPATITIRWYVVSYACGVRVQRGDVSMAGVNVLDVPIAPVRSTASSFVTWSTTAAGTDSIWGEDDTLTGDLTSTSNLQFRAGAVTGATRMQSWQVIEFLNPSDATVIRGSTSMLGTSLSTAVTLPSAVDLTKTFVLASFTSSGTGADQGARMLRAQLTSSTVLTIDRLISGSPDSIEAISYQVVQLNEGSSVQSGSAAFASGAATATATVSAIDPSRSLAFGSVQQGAGQSFGRSSYAADDVMGVASAAVAVTNSTTLTLTRANTLAPADIAWFLVQWGGPWWDTSYKARRQLTVTAGSVAVAAGYALSTEIDHADLVGAADALASGDDVRVVYFSAGTFTELDRVLDTGATWNSAATKLWFKSQASIPAGTADGSYWLYYAKPSAAAPPANSANVFLYSDGFEAGNLDAWTTGTPAGWYNASWRFRKAVTIDRTKVAAGGLTNFPVLVSVSDPDLAAKAQAGGGDILFTSSNGTTKLSHEVEKYTSANGQLVAWVRVPTLSATADTVLYLYYGNAAAADQQAATAVWDSSFASVYHLKEAPTGLAGDIRDSTATARHGKSLGTMGAGNRVIGQFGDGVTFDGVDDRIDTGTIASEAWTGVTLESWVKRTDPAANSRFLCKATGTSAAAFSMCLGGINGAARGLLGTDGTGGSNTAAYDGGTIGTGWQHVAMTWSAAAGSLVVYVDGVAVLTVAKGGATIKDSSTQPLLIAATNNDTTLTNFLKGILDEVRVSSAARSAGWISTQFNNQSAPATFATLGGEQAVSAPWSVGTGTARSGSYALRAGALVNANRWITANAVAGRTDVAIDSWWRVTGGTGFDVAQSFRTANSGSVINGYDGHLRPNGSVDSWIIAKIVNGSWTPLTSPPASQSTAGAWTRITTVISGTRMKVLKDGVQIVPASGWLDVGTELASGGVGFRAWAVPAGGTWAIDDLTVRPYLDTEPVTGVGTEDLL